jgi:hypothetical protein
MPGGTNKKPIKILPTPENQKGAAYKDGKVLDPSCSVPGRHATHHNLPLSTPAKAEWGQALALCWVASEKFEGLVETPQELGLPLPPGFRVSLHPRRAVSPAACEKPGLSSLPVHMYVEVTPAPLPW